MYLNTLSGGLFLSGMCLNAEGKQQEEEEEDEEDEEKEIYVLFVQRFPSSFSSCIKLFSCCLFGVDACVAVFLWNVAAADSLRTHDA